MDRRRRRAHSFPDCSSSRGGREDGRPVCRRSTAGARDSFRLRRVSIRRRIPRERGREIETSPVAVPSSRPHGPKTGGGGGVTPVVVTTTCTGRRTGDRLACTSYTRARARYNNNTNNTNNNNNNSNVREAAKNRDRRGDEEEVSSTPPPPPCPLRNSLSPTGRRRRTRAVRILLLYTYDIIPTHTRRVRPRTTVAAAALENYTKTTYPRLLRDCIRDNNNGRVL